MSSPNSLTLNDMIENIVEDVLKERAEQAKNQETIPIEEVRQKVGEMEGTEEVRVFLMKTEAKAF